SGGGSTRTTAAPGRARRRRRCSGWWSRSWSNDYGCRAKARLPAKFQGKPAAAVHAGGSVCAPPAKRPGCRVPTIAHRHPVRKETFMPILNKNRREFVRGAAAAVGAMAVAPQLIAQSAPVRIGYAMARTGPWTGGAQVSQEPNYILWAEQQN